MTLDYTTMNKNNGWMIPCFARWFIADISNIFNDLLSTNKGFIKETRMTTSISSKAFEKTIERQRMKRKNIYRLDTHM